MQAATNARPTRPPRLTVAGLTSLTRETSIARARIYARATGHRAGEAITRTVGPPPVEFWAPPVYPMIPGLSEIRTAVQAIWWGIRNSEYTLEIPDFPESSFTGSGHLIKNSGSCDETRRNSSSVRYRTCAVLYNVHVSTASISHIIP